MYINGMPETVKSNIRLFADDTIMYLTISNQSDCQDLQSDLTKLESWEREWLMAFNPDKCEVIRITKKKDPIIYDYKLHGITLQTTKNAKYLGLNISDDLSWSKHINQTTAKRKQHPEVYQEEYPNTQQQDQRNSLQNICQTLFGILVISLGSLVKEIHQDARDGSAQGSTLHLK